MKTVFFDCFSGISGDMILGALLDAGLDFDALKLELDKLHLSDFSVKSIKVVKQNISATKFDVIFPEQHHHRHLRNLNEIVDQSDLAIAVKEKAKKIFLKIAKAEAKIHNMPVEKVHFHEVGALDTIIDVVGSIVGLELLGIEKVYCSRLNVGSGFVTFSHGKFPVPAPATAEILKGTPTYSTDTRGELVTPTGAAIISIISDGFGPMPEIIINEIGYGAGSKDLDQPNVLRICIGESTPTLQAEQESVIVIETNIDDMNPQIYEHVIDKLLDAGALDVFLTNIFMKKNRPAIKLTALATPGTEAAMTKIILAETTSIGVRIRLEKRIILERKVTELSTRYGKVRIKTSQLNGEILNTMPEYDDMKRIAFETGKPLKQLYDEISKEI
jgi:pyridinium-3,5-bisthiocarboxylic acid mononucleotide nickel chelatase